MVTGLVALQQLAARGRHAEIDEALLERDLPKVGAVDFEDLDRIVTGPFALRALRLLFRTPLGGQLLPEVEDLRIDEAGAGRHKDNLDHSLRVAAQSPPVSLIRWASLFHDVGKPHTRVLADGKVTFHDHEKVSARLAKVRLRDLGAGRPFAAQVAKVILVAGRISAYEAWWSDAAVRRVAADGGDLLPAAAAVARADCTSRFPERRRAAHRRVDAFVTRQALIEARDRERARRPLLDGAEIMDLLGLSPGPLVGEARQVLLEAAVTDPGLSRDGAVALLRHWAQTAR